MTFDNHDELDKTRALSTSAEGTRISRYEVTGKLGSGGMGEVFLAFDTQLRRNVAVKVLSSAISTDEEMRARFLGEAQMAAALNHPNIVTVYEVGEYQHRPFIAMEYVEGQTLKELIRAGVMSVDRVRDVALQICEGLAAAHHLGIVHRDIKPANIKLSSEGRVKILDFGLAKFHQLSSVTRAGMILGTVSYMSPEQALGRDVDHRSDIFSLGVVLYEMLSGHLPFAGANDISIIHGIIHEPHAPLTQHQPDLPAEICCVVDKALQKAPLDRYQSACDLAQELCGVAGATTAVMRPVAPRIATIALLPFENLGPTEQEYLADGITDEITTDLAKVNGLRVISYSSSRQYKQSDKRPRQIGSELGADYLLQGTILWDSSGRPPRVRINTRLIRVSDESYLWAEKYDRVVDQIFALQSELGEKVTEALGVALLEPERKTIAAKRTGNLDAYDYYLRGNEFFPRSTAMADLSRAVEMYAKACEIDPQYAPAWARMARAHLTMYWFYHDRSPKRLAQAREAVDRAVKAAPESSEVYLALGYYHYYGNLDYARALQQFAIAKEARPNDSGLLAALGFIQRRLGLWDEALANIRKATELDPRSALLGFELGNTCLLMRRYDDAVAAYDRAVELAPDFIEAYAGKAQAYLLRDGCADRAVDVFRQAEEKFDPSFMVIEWSLLDAFVAYCGGDCARALEKLTVDETEMETYFINKARLAQLMRDTEQARSCFESARAILESKLRSESESARFLSHLGVAYAGLGRKDQAMEVGKKAVELFPFAKDRVYHAVYAHTLSLAYVMVQEYDAAIDLLQFLLSGPSSVSKPLLRFSSDYAPLRDHQRFRDLVGPCGAGS